MILDYFLSIEFWNFAAIVGACVFATLKYGKLLLDYFDPTNRKLNFFNKYKNHYGSSFSENINMFINTQINNLSVIKISKLNDLNKALIFIEISNKNKMIKINYRLLRDILNKAFIRPDRTIFLLESDKQFYSKHRVKKIYLSWYILSTIGFISLLSLAYMFYGIYTGEKEINSLNILFCISMSFYSYLGISTLLFNQPLTYEIIYAHFKMIDDWNDNVKEK